jgi:cell fate (sporulation/competence/biofilm development) regulator YmcA (YheA/YmcA/DUF963 family)
MNNLIDEFDELLELIKQSDEYKEYVRLKELVSNNEDIKRLTDEIKKIQKRIVRSNGNKVLEKELESKNIELNSIPLYNDYIESIDKLNELLLIVKNKFDSFINELILRW